MAGSYNDNVARTVNQGQVAMVATAFRPLVANQDVANGDSSGKTPQKARRHVRYQTKSALIDTVALAYVQQNADGTFTTPTDAVKNCTLVTGNSTVVEPIGDSVNVYGKLVPKAGSTTTSIRVIVTEYS